MTKQLFTKLAVRNIRSNKQIYIPYMIASIATVSMFYLMFSLVRNEFIQTRSSSLPMMFILGSIVIGVFSFIFIMYTNSFLIKRRKKEIGLYAILGMKKKHVALVLTIESLITSLTSIAVGVISGQIIGRLIFLALNYALNFPVSMEYPFSFSVALITAVGFMLIFFVALLYNISQVTFINPIKLVKGKQTGEKEPKSSLILFLLSLVFLGAGYWISFTIKDPVSAMAYFFVAVVLVIIGTYLLFISGSIFILKALKRNKKFYYQPNAFISISGMLYRMKQNAAGLANICILATMVIITIATTLTIFVGTEQTLENRFPYEHNVTVYDANAQQLAYVEDAVQTTSEQADLAIENYDSYRYQSLFGEMKDNKFVVKQFSLGDNIPLNMILIPKEDFESMLDVSLNLEEGEVALYHSENDYQEGTIEIAEKAYSIQDFEKDTTGNTIVEGMEEIIGAGITESMLVVMNEVADIDSVRTYYEETTAEDLYFNPMMATIGWDIKGSEDEKIVYADNIEEELNQPGNSMHYQSRDSQRAEWYSMNGGFLFLGVFLGMLFTFGAILITYFKQVSEGYDDREKFQIMQKVGLDKKTIRKSTRSQIVWMFFLPLLIAVIHVAFAFPIIRKLLVLFGIVEAGLIIKCIAAVVLFFSLLYWIIYRVTSRVYYSIVE